MGILHVRDFPDDLQRAARVEALEADQTLREFLVDAVRREVERRRAERAEGD